MILPLPDQPRALFGGPLHGGRAVKYLYVDEAGKSAIEPITIVAGVIIDADTQWKRAQAEANRLADEFVPASLRKGFYFSAKTVYGGGRERDDWPLHQRLSLCYGMMSAPRRLNMPISIGMVRRDPPSQPHKRYKPDEIDHIEAFLHMAIMADRYMRREAALDEVLTTVCEDVERVKDAIRAVIQYVRDNPFRLNEAYLHLSDREKQTGVVEQTGEYAITRLVDTVHYVKKKDGPLLQFADALAYAFKRYFEKKHYGNEMLKAVLGSDLRDEEAWVGKVHGSVFQWTPPKPPSAEEVPFRLIG